MTKRKLPGAIGFAVIALLTACSSSTKHVESQDSSPVAPPSASHVQTSEDLAAKYSLAQLNSVANLLKVVIDESGTKPSKDVGSDLIGCPLTGTQASTMTMPVKMLIDSQMRFEADAYTTDPKNYATEKGFESCASQCACGVFSDVVEAANASSVPQAARRVHARNKQSLSVKASHQTGSDSLACAKRITWFCGSDLKAYLEKQSRD